MALSGRKNQLLRGNNIEPCRAVRGISWNGQTFAVR
jgi:hypothetical protein